MKKTMLAVVASLALLCGAAKSSHATYDGTPSTGSFTIATNSGLAQAYASGTLTVISTAGSRASRLSLGTVVLTEGRDWRVGATTMTAAASLTTAINAAAIPVTATYSAGMSAITLAADYPGALYNAFGLLSSTPTALSASGANLTGGQDNASIYIGAIQLTQGRDWFKQDVASNTAINLAASINHNAQTSAIVSAAWLGGSSATVYLRSVLSPVAYSLSDSAGSAITSPDATMKGGAAGNITPYPCNLGRVNSLPTSNYPAGCTAFLTSDATHIYLSTEAVAGSQSWLAIVTSASSASFASLTVSGAATIGTTLGVTGASTLAALTASTITATGYLRLASKSLAQLAAIIPAFVGEQFYCSDCTTDAVATSTQAVTASWARSSDKATPVQ